MMKIYKGFKYRLLPTKEQEQMLLQHGGNTRFLWNLLLKQNMDYYKETNKFMFRYEMSRMLPKLKQEYPFLKESFSQSLQVVAMHLDVAIRESFNKSKGFPKFKKKSMLTDSFHCPQGWKIKKGSVFIPKLGWVKWIKHRPLQGKPKSITITQDGNKWFCSVLCECEIEEREKKTNNIVGIDVGLKEFATLSDGTVIANPKYIRKYEKKLIKEQRKLSRKRKGSKNRFKQRLKVRKIHEKILNVRKDFLHKISSSIVKNYDGVVLENLNVKGMMRNHNLAKSVADVSWSTFRQQLEYKCKWESKHFIVIDRFAPTSKTCSNCGHIQEMPLNVRQFNCPNCGVSIDRDLNASLNIKNLGLHTLRQSGIYACGDSSLEMSLKQEKECLVNQAEAIRDV